MLIRSLFFLIAFTFFVFSAFVPCFADDALNHFQKGNLYSEEGKYELAIEEYRKAIKINHRIGDFHYNLANMLFVTDKVKEAIQEYKKAISLNPFDYDFQRNLGIAYVAAGEISKAKKILKEIKKKNHKNAQQLESFLTGVKKK